MMFVHPKMNNGSIIKEKIDALPPPCQEGEKESSSFLLMPLQHDPTRG
jgi:hypothetical protein